MKNIFDLRAKEQFLREKEIELNVKDATYSARWAAKELEKKNEIEDVYSKCRKDLKLEEITHSIIINDLEIKHKKELSDKEMRDSEHISDLNCAHKEQLAELREEMKAELGIKAIELEKELAVTKKSNAELLNNIIILTNDKSNLEKELKEMTATALMHASKSAEVRVVDTKVVAPQIVGNGINTIPTDKE